MEKRRKDSWIEKGGMWHKVEKKSQIEMKIQKNT